MILASIPSPSFDSIDLGPLSLNIYGLCIALGVIAAIWLFGRRLEERGVGTRDDASAIGLVSVLAGVIGSRLYHVATDWERFDDDLAAIPKIWEGGLGIPGGLLLGIPVGLWMSRRHGIGIAVAATCAAPAIPLAQAIGRWGNYFNQELYGRPTDLPWALEIDTEHLVGTFPPGTTFHPTFLYESIWSLGLVLLLLWIDRRFRPPDGQLLMMYLIGYGAGRFWVEGLRIDRADELGGLRWNQWVALAAVIGGLAALAVWPDRRAGDRADRDGPGPDALDVLDDDDGDEPDADAEDIGTEDELDRADGELAEDDTAADRDAEVDAVDDAGEAERDAIDDAGEAEPDDTVPDEPADVEEAEPDITDGRAEPDGDGLDSRNTLPERSRRRRAQRRRR